MMNDRDRRWLALLAGVISFAVGTIIEARGRSDRGLFPDVLMFIGGSMVMWMAAKLFWTDDPPEWFAIFVFFGWLIILGMTMNLMRRGILL
jgi:predicted MFS family arabinose efflux permease